MELHSISLIESSDWNKVFLLLLLYKPIVQYKETVVANVYNDLAETMYDTMWRYNSPSPPIVIYTAVRGHKFSNLQQHLVSEKKTQQKKLHVTKY